MIRRFNRVFPQGGTYSGMIGHCETRNGYHVANHLDRAFPELELKACRLQKLEAITCAALVMLFHGRTNIFSRAPLPP